MTRDLDWGVPVPVEGAEGKVLYVWLDAPIGYISATKKWAADNGKNWEDYWKNEETRLVHFIGKDNIFFHTVYCRLAQAELASLGFHTRFDVVDIDTKDPEIWRGVKRRYWWGDKYFLPTCTLTGGR